MGITQETMIFMHIPKTGGTTLNRIIERQYDSAGVFSNDQVIGAELGENWKGVSPLDRWNLGMNTLGRVPDERKQRIRIIKGHMRFGSHRLLPQPSAYFTLLRDPIDLVISYYYYVLGLDMDGHFIHEEIVQKQMGLKEFVVSGITSITNNIQCRFISGVGGEVDYGQCSREVLEVAKQNLSEFFVVVGLMERFDETLILLRRNLGWGVPLYIKHNVTKSRPRKKDVSTETLKVIEYYNKWDVELYEYARGIFERSIDQQPNLYKVELATFRLLNGVYQFLQPVFSNYYSLLRSRL